MPRWLVRWAHAHSAIAPSATANHFTSMVGPPGRIPAGCQGEADRNRTPQISGVGRDEPPEVVGSGAAGIWRLLASAVVAWFLVSLAVILTV